MKLKIIAIVAAGLIVVSISYLYVTRNRAVVFRYGDRASGQNAFLIQNPFRERGPEDEAEKLLQQLKSGNCDGALALPAVDPASIGGRCEKEAWYPLQSWSIVDRQDIGRNAILVYKMNRNEHSDTVPAGNTQTYSTLAWIDVEKAGDDRWRTLSYQTYY